MRSLCSNQPRGCSTPPTHGTPADLMRWVSHPANRWSDRWAAHVTPRGNGGECAELMHRPVLLRRVTGTGGTCLQPQRLSNYILCDPLGSLLVCPAVPASSLLSASRVLAPPKPPSPPVQSRPKRPRSQNPRSQRPRWQRPRWQRPRWQRPRSRRRQHRGRCPDRRRGRGPTPGRCRRPRRHPHLTLEGMGGCEGGVEKEMKSVRN